VDGTPVPEEDWSESFVGWLVTDDVIIEGIADDTMNPTERGYERQ
jgi:hypothetical protein